MLTHKGTIVAFEPLDPLKYLSLQLRDTVVSSSFLRTRGLSSPLVSSLHGRFLQIYYASKFLDDE